MTHPRERTRAPVYARLLRLKHVHPNSWQRAALGEGALAVAGMLVLADLASLWVLLALPITVAVVVKGHDVLAGLLEPVHPSAASARPPEVLPTTAGIESDAVVAPPAGIESDVVVAPPAEMAVADEPADAEWVEQVTVIPALTPPPPIATARRPQPRGDVPRAAEPVAESQPAVPAVPAGYAESSVRVIPAPAPGRKAARRPGAASARAQADAARPRRKSES